MDCPCWRITFEARSWNRPCYRTFSRLQCTYSPLLTKLLCKKITHKDMYNWCFFFVGFQPRIDEKHPKWLHLRIRPLTLPFLDPTKRGVYEKLKSKGLVDGRWTLAFRDDDSCSSACSMVLHEIDLQCREVERRLKSLFDLDRNQQDQSNVTSHAFSSSTLPADVILHWILNEFMNALLEQFPWFFHISAIFCLFCFVYFLLPLWNGFKCNITCIFESNLLQLTIWRE